MVSWCLGLGWERWPCLCEWDLPDARSDLGPGRRRAHYPGDGGELEPRRQRVDSGRQREAVVHRPLPEREAHLAGTDTLYPVLQCRTFVDVTNPKGG